MASGFRRVHGLSLVGNSYIENLHFEPVTQDPIPVRAGRVWFNTTEKLYKFSTLDDTGAVVVNAFASREETLASIEALNVRVTALEDSYVNKNGSVAFTGDVNAGGHKVVNVATPTADTDAATKAYVDSGISDVQAAVSALGNAFNYVGTVDGGTAEAPFDLATLSEKDTGDYYKVSVSGYFKVGSGNAFVANANDGLAFNLAGGVDIIDNTNSAVSGTASEIAVTGSTDTGFVVAIDAAFKARVSTIEDETTSLQSELDATQQGAGLGTDGVYSAPQNANYIASATSLANADFKLDAAIKAADNRALAKEQELADSIGTETQRAQNAESGLQDELDATQDGAGLNADGSYSAPTNSHYLAAATNLSDATSKLDTALKDESDRALTAEADLQTAINDVAALAGEGTSALKNAINAQQMFFQSSAPALQHIITHNMGTRALLIDPYAKGEDGLFRNDLVAITKTTLNSITVDLTEAMDIEVSIKSIAPLA
ncbi:MAG: hypothetical protein ACMV0I_00970 [Pseudomonas sp.]